MLVLLSAFEIAKAIATKVRYNNWCFENVQWHTAFSSILRNAYYRILWNAYVTLNDFKMTINDCKMKTDDYHMHFKVIALKSYICSGRF